MRQAFCVRRAARGLSVAVAGLFAGHLLVYRIVAPGALQRALLLAGTGHGYLPAAVAVGIVAAAAAGLAVFGAAFLRGRCGAPRPQRHGLIPALVVPAIAQACSFLVLETLERALAGAPMGGLVGPLLPVGILLQLAVGALGGLVLFGLDRAGERAGHCLAAARRPPRRRSAPSRARAGTLRIPRLLSDGSFGIRGPPLAA